MQRVIRTAAIFLVAGVRVTGAQVETEVKTSSETVRGTTTADGTVRVFKGIPCAAPPVGEWRGNR